jgi:hypothetical protein
MKAVKKRLLHADRTSFRTSLLDFVIGLRYCTSETFPFTNVTLRSL